MRFKINKLLVKIVIGSLVGVILALGSYVGVQAAGYTLGNPPLSREYNRGPWYGYFSNVKVQFGKEVLPAMGSKLKGDKLTDAIPQSVNTVAKFIAILKAANKSRDDQRVTGSAFIVNTMLGRNGPGGGRNVSAADWATITARLNDRQANKKIDWIGNAVNNINSYYQNGGANDDALYYDGAGLNEPGIQIYDDSGNLTYALLRRCANPVGENVGGVSKPTAVWGLSAASTVNTVILATGKVITKNVTTAKPGDTLQWTHQLTNDGPDATTVKVHSNLLITGFSNGWGTSPPAEYGPGDTAAGAAAKKVMRTIVSYAKYTVTQADVGNKLCEMVRYKPSSSSSAASGAGNNSCVTVPYVYTLTPSVTPDVSGVVEPGAPVNLASAVANNGSTKSKPTQWQLTQIVVQPGSAVPNPAGGNSLLLPCGTYFTGPGAVCSTLKSGINTVFKNGNNPLASNLITAGDLSVGTKICFALSVQPRAGNDNKWVHSAPICLVVGKKPKIQVWGGDLSVGKSFSGSAVPSNVQTSNSVKSGNTFGSWIEYGIFATGSVSGVASGSAYAGPGLAGATTCQASMLSFTNATDDNGCTDTTSIGNYATTRSIPDVASSFTGSGSVLPPAVVPNNLTAGGVFIGTSAGNLTINTSTLNPGKSVILKVNGTVTIAGDQKYNPGPYASVSQLPQLVIMADKIIINSAVTNVDAWLIANGPNGIIETCDTGSATYILSGAQGLTSNKCQTPLTINGPVMAKQLWLRRTAGSGTGAASGDPAEVFNLSPDAYMWAQAQATSGGRIQTVYTTELPPRL